LVHDDQNLPYKLDNSQLDAIAELTKCYGKIRRLLPVLATNLLKATNKQLIKEGTQLSLKKISLEAGILVLANNTQTSVLIEILSQNSIPFIFLKGAAFNHYIYSNSAPRISNDIDILIKSSDWEKAFNLMNQVMDYSEKPIDGKFADLYEVSYKPKEKIGFHLDMHKLLIHPYLFKIEETELWNESIEHPHYKNEDIRILSPELNLLHLAIHAYKDMDFYNYSLVDCHRLISKEAINWQVLVNTAKRMGATNILYFLLINCSRVLASPIPEDTLEQCRPNALIRKIASWLVISDYRQPEGNIKSYRFRFNQILGQFVFTGSLLRPLKLQLTYLGLLQRYA
jgi:hypothetical protein